MQAHTTSNGLRSVRTRSTRRSLGSAGVRAQLWGKGASTVSYKKGSRYSVSKGGNRPAGQYAQAGRASSPGFREVAEGANVNRKGTLQRVPGPCKKLTLKPNFVSKTGRNVSSFLSHHLRGMSSRVHMPIRLYTIYSHTHEVRQLSS